MCADIDRLVLHDLATPEHEAARLLLCLIISVVLLVCALPIDCLHGQEKRQPRKVLFGVPLNHDAKSLLAEVERTFEKQVEEEWLFEKEAQCGNSKVGDDGTPIIQINPVCGRNIDTIVHELYHFKLRSQGYPVLYWLYPRVLDTEANRKAFNQLAQQLHDPILHYVFYPKVRLWRINPGKAFETLTKQGLQDNSLPTTLATMDKEAIGLYWFKIRLEVSDPLLLARIEEALEKKQKRSGIELGNRLARIVISSNPQSPEKDIDTLVECLNVFYEGRFHFKQRGWTSRLLGRHVQQVAQIELEPLR